MPPNIPSTPLLLLSLRSSSISFLSPLPLLPSTSSQPFSTSSSFQKGGPRPKNKLGVRGERFAGPGNGPIQARSDRTDRGGERNERPRFNGDGARAEGGSFRREEGAGSRKPEGRPFREERTGGAGQSRGRDQGAFGRSQDNRPPLDSRRSGQSFPPRDRSDGGAPGKPNAGIDRSGWKRSAARGGGQRGDRGERNQNREDFQRPTTSRRLAQNLSPQPQRPPAPSHPSKPTFQPKPPKVLGDTHNKGEAALPVKPFLAYGLNQAMEKDLKALLLGRGKEGEMPLPTEIQHLALEHFVAEKNTRGDKGKKKVEEAEGDKEDGRKYEALLGSSTGSGKTLAYLLPLIHHLKKTDPGLAARPQTASEKLSIPGIEEEAEDDTSTPASKAQTLPRALVLCPTHELARQIITVTKSLCHGIKLSSLGLSSTSSGDIRPGPVDILVGTGRGLKRKVEKGYLGVKDVEWVVVDEGDVMFGENFVEETNSLVDQIKEERKVAGLEVNMMVATATIPPSLLNHIEANQPDMARVLSPSLHRLPTKLKTNFVPWSRSGNKLADVVHETKRVLAADSVERKVDGGEKCKILVFVNSVNKVKALEKIMTEKGVNCYALTGEGDDRVRGSNGQLNAFLRPTKAAAEEEKGTAKQPRVLIATSLLSRGLDFDPSVSHVFLVEEPKDALDFLHRSGRTGRGGLSGQVTIFGSSPVRSSRFGGNAEAGRAGMKAWVAGSRLGNDLKDVLQRKG